MDGKTTRQAKNALILALALAIIGSACAQNKVYKQAPLWAHQVPGKINALRTLNDTILVGGENGIYAFDYNKAQKWFRESPGAVTSIRTLKSKDIVAASSDGIVRRYARNGSMIWERQLPGYVGYDNAVDAKEGAIACGSMDGYVYLLSPNGTYMWKHLVGSYVINVRILGDSVVAVSDRQVYILDLDGKVRRNLNILGFIRSADVTDDRIIIGMSDGVVYVWDTDGGPLWTYKMDEYISAVDGGSNITVGSRERHVLHFTDDGRLLWSLNMTDAVTTVRGDGNRILVGTQDQKVYLYTGAGAMTWYYETDGRPTEVSVSDPDIVSATTTGWIYYTKLPKRDVKTSFMVSVAVMAIVGAALIMISRSWR